jgi:DNA-directed RNA polymerase subunit K/omega
VHFRKLKFLGYKLLEDFLIALSGCSVHKMEEYPDAGVVEEEYDDYEEDLDVDVEEDYEEEGVPDIEDVEEEAEDELCQKFDTTILLNEKDENHRIIRVVPDDDRVSSNIIQWYEYTEAVGIRASQFEKGAPAMTDVSGLKDPIEMAKKEFNDRKCPLILERALKVSATEKLVEHWKVSEMDFPRNLQISAPTLTLNRINELKKEFPKEFPIGIQVHKDFKEK